MKTVQVKVKHNARQCKVVVADSSQDDSKLEVSLTQPPTDNRANLQLMEVLAKYFHCKPSQVLLLKGQSCRIKVVGILS